MSDTNDQENHYASWAPFNPEVLNSYFTHALDLLCIADSDGYFRRLNKEWETTLGYSIAEIEGTRFLDYVHPDDLESTQSAVSQLGDRKKVLNFVNRYRTKNGSYRWIEWRLFPSGNLIYASARDITNRILAEDALHARTQQLEALGLISAEITRELDLNRLLTLIHRRAAALFGVKAGFLSLYDQTTQTLTIRSWEGHGDWANRLSFQFGKGISGTVAARRLGMVVNDYKNSVYAVPLINDNTTLTSVVAEPLIYRDRLVGVITLDNQDALDRTFTEEDRSILTLFAAQAAIAIENARLFEAVNQELADRTRAEVALQDSEQRFRTMAEASFEGIAVTAEGKLLDTNDQLAAMLGYNRSEIIGRPIELFIAHEARKLALEAHQSRSVKPYEHLMLRKDGSRFPVEIRARYALIAGHEVRIAAIRDITERKSAMDALQEERLLMETLLRSLPGIFYLYTYPELRLVRWNKNHETLLNYDPKEINNRSLFDWHPPETVNLVRQAVEVVMEKGENIIESPLLTKDGRSIPFLLTGNKLEFQGASYMLGVGIDITERQRAEEEREKLQAKLNQSQRMDSVGQLAGGIAHDFNNMLTAILGHAQLALQRCAPSNPIHAHLEAIEQAIHRSADLIRQLLGFARKQTVAPKVLDLNETVAGMIPMLRRLIGEAIDFVWKPDIDLQPVRIDPSQIDQLLVNLCLNSRDAIAGVGKITIETGNAAFDETHCAVHPGFVAGEYSMLAVSDDGCGIDKDLLDHIFEPFFTTKEIGSGTGLGLATVYGIVKQNAGFINVYSEPGKGTTFRIYLPGVAGLKIEPVGTKIAAISEGRGETVLLVEDNEAILEVTREMLEGLGYRVVTAGRPSEALQQAKEHSDQIKLVITDVVMPEMNGQYLAKLLVNIIPGLKCLFSSGYTANVITHHGVLDEGVNFLQKPFSINDLAMKISEAFQQK
jgi:PAS domain S-box-containing protein